jgi:DNA replication protein DnaC
MNLDQLLDRLKMDHLQAAVDTLCEHASKQDLNYREFLEQALAQEWGGRHQKGLETRLKQARLPWIKTLEQFDFSFQPSIDRKLVRELSGLGFVERNENVILLGPPGVGKTHLAVALGVKAAEAGHRVLFMTLDRLVSTLVKARQENRLERQLQQLTYPKVLIENDMGTLSAAIFRCSEIA